jgi:2-keto-4-pentenoate hydratase/2-oxohepta-3-ene-1,7-dioic acid hydratase in catechol pathway
MNNVKWNGGAIMPSKVVCVGRNYAKHVAELNNTLTGDMVIFMKPNASISPVLQAVHGGESLHYEGEICFLVEGGQFVAIGFGLDLTKRQLQVELKKKQLPWERAKSFTGAAVLGDFVTLDTDIDNAELSIELWVGEDKVQCGSVADMLFAPSTILNDVKGFIDLEDGDVVMTGTPEGVGQIRAGATYTGRIVLGDRVLIESSWLAHE